MGWGRGITNEYAATVNTCMFSANVGLIRVIKSLDYRLKSVFQIVNESGGFGLQYSGV